jgi:GntR family transcriptional regulator, carbon starvation induced regulator
LSIKFEIDNKSNPMEYMWIFTEDSEVDEGPSKETLTEIAVERLTADIVDGVFPPERKLLMADLKKRYSMGASPLREGLSRLSSLGLVIFDSRRGFRVAPVSREDLEDITRVRQVIETTALRRAIEYGDDEWEVGIVAAYTRLQRVIARRRNGESAAGADVESAHRLFHTALIAACRSHRLLELHKLLYDQARRYRQVMLGQAHDLDEFLRTHEALVKVVLKREVDKACAALASHLQITMDKVYPEVPSRPRAGRKNTVTKSARVDGTRQTR